MSNTVLVSNSAKTARKSWAHAPRFMSDGHTNSTQLALTVYGELDISVLDQSPAVRAGVDTSIISPNSTDQMFASVNEQLKKRPASLRSLSVDLR